MSIAVAAMLSCTLYFTGGVVLPDVPVARTLQEKAQGLSHRDSAGQGMLFTWPEAQPLTFWMRNTRIPLSIAFINADGSLDAIVDMEPMSDDRHHSPAPAQAALELAQGQFEALGLEVGSTLINRTCTGDKS